jgi:hypothetical protein
LKIGYATEYGNMARTVEDANKTLMLEAFDTLFNKRGYCPG